METTITKLLSVQSKLQQLLKRHEALQKENEQLKNELAKLRSDTAAHAQQIEQLNQQLTVKNLNVGNWSDEDKKALEKKINVYLKEIDKCLNLLNT